MKAGDAVARSYITTDYDDRERYDAIWRTYMPRQQEADAEVEREFRELEALMRHPAYRRERGAVRQVRHD